MPSDHFTSVRPGNCSDLLKYSSLRVSRFHIIGNCLPKRTSTPAKLRADPSYLQQLPYLTKDIIRREGTRLLSERFSQTALHVRKTGGSTGPSALIYYSQEALDWTAAVNLLVLEWAGKKRHWKEVHLSTRFPGSYSSQRSAQGADQMPGS